MSDSKLQSAQLQVVLPGTRASFRRRVIEAMRELVPATGGFSFFGKEDGRAYADATRLVDSVAVAGPQPRDDGHHLKLSAAFGFDPKSVVAAPRRAYVSSELWPESERARLPYFAECSAHDGFVHALLLFLHEGGVLFGLAGLERRASEGEFGEGEKRALEELAPFVVAGARAQLQYDELSREAAALRALGKVSGVVYVVDRDRKRVVWAADREHGIDWDDDVAPIEEQLVDAAEQSLAARQRGDALPTPPRLPAGTLVAVARIEDEPVFGGARCAAVRVEAPKKPGPIEGLSKREREIARLLVAGYSGVNVAAISGLSENTVRTYVRRLYAKLGVNNRADLVRKLVSPEVAPSGPPSSHIAPPPDSALVGGDDTLD
ncbi:MAG TPA: LuxR C-terminal-related transcriptional regulator [Polyangiaceae bacterium]|nr:LuxR C-terminal-related transcriptional regulator [Polyangiaceae bacterium]